MYLSPLLAGSRARSCQKRKSKQHISISTDVAKEPRAILVKKNKIKNLGELILYLHKDLNRAFSHVQKCRTQISALIHRGGRV